MDQGEGQIDREDRAWGRKWEQECPTWGKGPVEQLLDKCRNSPDPKGISGHSSEDSKGQWEWL